MSRGLLVGADDAVARWVLDKVPHAGDLAPYTAIGVLSDDGGMVAGVIFHNYQPRFRALEITMAADTARWATRGTIGALLRYPFAQQDCIRVTTIIPRKNKRARRFNEGLGFRLEGVVRKGFLTDDACIYGLLRADAARWIGGEHG